MDEKKSIFSVGLNTVNEAKITTRKELFDAFNEDFKEGLWKVCVETAIAYGVGLGLLMLVFPLIREKEDK